MADVTVPQSATVLNAFAAIFQNNLVTAPLVTWNKFKGEMNDRNGLRVVEQVTPDYTTEFIKNGVKDLSGGVQDTDFGSEQYELTQTINSSMGWGDFIKIRDIGDARESEALKSAALRLARDIDSYILGFATLQSNNWVGGESSDIATFNDIATAVTRLKQEGVEDNFTAVLDYADWQALGNDVVGQNRPLNDIGSGIYRQGWQGNIAGIPTVFTQQLPSFQLGSRVATVGTSKTDYATGSPDNDYTDVHRSNAPGNWLTGELKLKGQSGAVTILDGEVFTIAGVYAYDNRAKKTLNHLQQFRVVGDVTTTSGAGTIRYFPAIITDGPYRTVTNTNGGGTTWNNLDIVHKGAASAVAQPRLLISKDAISVYTADLIMPASGQGLRRALTKVPLSVRMWKASDFDTGEHKVRFDVALQANVKATGRERLIRVNGAS